MNDWRFVLRADLDDEQPVVAPVFAAELLERWIANRWRRDEVIELIEELTGVDSGNLYQLRPRDLHAFVLPRIERALMTGELALVAPEVLPLGKIQIVPSEEPVGKAPEPVTKEPEKKKEEKELGWIDFRLIDQKGNPVSGKAWKIKLPDGTEREGVTGKDGLVRLRDIPEGTCEITYTELAPDAWKVA